MFHIIRVNMVDEYFSLVLGLLSLHATYTIFHSLDRHSSSTAHSGVSRRLKDPHLVNSNPYVHSVRTRLSL